MNMNYCIMAQMKRNMALQLCARNKNSLAEKQNMYVCA